MKVSWVSVAGGVLVLAVSSSFFLSSFHYELGNLARMKPGLFPAILGGVGIIFGAALVINGLFSASEETYEQFPIRAFLCTLIGIAGFALLIRTAGLLPAVLASTGLSALGDRRNSLLDVLLLAAGASSLVWIVFVWGLGLAIPLVQGML